MNSFIEQETPSREDQPAPLSEFVNDGGRPRADTGFRVALLLACLALTGCAHAPSITVFGASFPDWLFCMVAGVIATSLVHAVMSKGNRLALLRPLPVSYLGLTTIFAVLVWLLVFSH